MLLPPLSPSAAYFLPPLYVLTSPGDQEEERGEVRKQNQSWFLPTTISEKLQCSKRFKLLATIILGVGGGNRHIACLLSHYSQAPLNINQSKKSLDGSRTLEML